MENIIVRDLKVIKKGLKVFYEITFDGIPFMYRWFGSIFLSIFIIKKFEIKELVFLNGWINITVIYGALGIYFIFWLFHKTYRLGNWMRTNTT